MIGFPSAVRVFVWTEPTDMRRGYDGLAALVRAHGQSEYSGHLYVFLSRRRDRCKVLWWEKGGLVVWSKRLEVGTFSRPPAADASGVVRVDAATLALLLEGIDLSTVQRPRRWEPPASKLGSMS